MLWRFFIFLLLQGCGAVLGWWLAGLWGLAAGVALAAWLAWAWALQRALQVVRWLRQGADPAHAPRLQGLWGESVQRILRILRQEHQQTQASAQRLQDFLAAFQASPNGVLLLDEQGRMEWFNEQAARHWGLDPQRDVQQHLGNLLREPVFSAYEAAGDYRHEVLLDGRCSTLAHPVRLSVQLHLYGEGRRLMLSRDVTAIEQAEAMRRDFVANVSHEIRTPLTVLGGFIETLQTLPLQEAEQARYLALMAQQAERMHHLVQDLLTLSRLEGSAIAQAQEWTCVHTLLARCEAEARALSQKIIGTQAKAQHLVFPDAAYLQSCGFVAGNAQDLHSALSNLIGNAVRYTPAGGKVQVDWQRLPEGGARFSVRDSGPGIAAEHLPRLTERFYRVDRSRSRDSGGTGLGLAIAKHALQRHGAQLHIASELGRGAEFSVVFAPHLNRS